MDNQAAAAHRYTEVFLPETLSLNSYAVPLPTHHLLAKFYAMSANGLEPTLKGGGTIFMQSTQETGLFLAGDTKIQSLNTYPVSGRPGDTILKQLCCTSPSYHLLAKFYAVLANGLESTSRGGGTIFM